MALYPYQKPGADVSRLHQEIAAAGLPVDFVSGPDAAGLVTVATTRDLTAPEVTTLDGVVAAHDGRPRRPRLLFDIYQDVNNLTGTQKQKIGADLFGGSPSKISQDRGANAPDLLLIFTLRSLVVIPEADKRLLETDAISIYTSDNVSYLVHPPFAPEINVPGDEVVP